MTGLQPFTEAQTRQLHILKVRGYQLTIIWRDEEKLQIVVAGRDVSGARLIGAIDATGKFMGEHMDYAPSWVGVGAPPPEATIEELIG